MFVLVCSCPHTNAGHSCDAKTKVKRFTNYVLVKFTCYETLLGTTSFFFVSASHRVAAAGQSTRGLFFWQVLPDVLVYRLHADEAAEDDEVEDGVSSFKEWQLPHRCVAFLRWKAALHHARTGI
jgi:hypothetical protein